MDIMKHAGNVGFLEDIEKPVNLREEKVAMLGTKKEVLDGGANVRDGDSSFNKRKLSASVPLEDTNRQGGQLSKFKEHVHLKRSKLIMLKRTIKKVKDLLKLSGDDMEGNIALNTVIMQIMSNWLECICLLWCEPGQVKVRNKTKDQDLTLDKDELFKKLDCLCHELLGFLKLLEENQAEGNIDQAKTDLKGLKFAPDSTEEDSDCSYGNLLKIKTLREQLVLIKLFLRDLHVGNFQNFTVEARVIVRGISWCMFNWRPTDLGTMDDQECHEYNNKCFWIPESILPQKFVVEEDKKLPSSVCYVEGELQSNPEEKAKVINTVQYNLSDTVHKYLTSDMKIEDFVSLINESIKISPEDFEKIKRQLQNNRFK